MAAGRATACAARTEGTVVTYGGDTGCLAGGHERLTLQAVAKALATIKGYRYAGDYDSRTRYDGPLYFVPRETLLASEARALAIVSENDVFGGVVPYPFIGTKTITHPLIDNTSAREPTGWSHRFAERVRPDVLLGFAAFSPDDAHLAGIRMLQTGPARLKLACGIGGSGQTTVRDESELDAAIAALDQQEILRHGLVVEQNLTEVMTYSVGKVRVAGLCITYYGTQRLTRNNQGQEVYGGSDLVIVRGDFNVLLTLAPDPSTMLAVQQAQRYDAAAREEYADLFASRRNYDVARGLDAAGRPCSGVLEQSWRVGGATPAELPALGAFLADRTLRTVRASAVEVYGDCDPPAGAAVMFRGVDPRIGPLTKYSIVVRDGHTP